MEARMEIATTEVVQLVAEQVMADLRPWIEQEKAKHVRRIVNIAKRGFERIEKVWDENEPCSPKEESLAAATLDKHDAIIRRNLGMNETSTGSCSLNLHVLTGGHTIIEA
jgi:rRNA-processing protein FCF1